MFVAGPWYPDPIEKSVIAPPLFNEVFACNGKIYDHASIMRSGAFNSAAY
jgi:hypothetical protein